MKVLKMKKLPLRVLFTFVALLCAESFLAKAIAMDREEALFEEGYWKYLTNDCGNAIANFYAASESGEFRSKSFLYSSICHLQGNAPETAAKEMQEIDVDDLNAEEKQLYDKVLVIRLARYQHLPDKYWATVTPYAGMGVHRPRYTKNNTDFQGILGKMGNEKWSAALGVELLKLRFQNIRDDYRQNQFYGQYTRQLGTQFSLSGSLTLVNSTNSQIKGILVFGLESTFQLIPSVIFMADLYHSTYPQLLHDTNTLQGKYLAVTQAGLGTNFRIVKGADSSLWAQFYGSRNWSNYDNASSLMGNPEFQNIQARVEEKLRWYLEKSTSTLTLWQGSEILGVRSEGVIVLPTITDRYTGGWGLDFAYNFTTGFGASVHAGQERYDSFGKTIVASTGTAMAWFNF